MRNKEMVKIRRKRNVIIAGIALMFILLGSLVTNKIVNVDRYNGKVKTINVEVKPLTESIKKEVKETTDKTVEEEKKEETVVKGYEVIEYKVSYTLESIDNVKGREAIITASLSNEERKYARFLPINEENVTSEIKNNGKEIEVRVKNVETNVKKEIILKIELEGAPSGYKVSPIVSVREKTEEKEKKVISEEVKVEGVSIEGTVRDKEGNIKSGVEITLCKMEEEVCVSKKVTYTKEDGRYTFSNLEEGRYKVTSDKQNEYILTSDVEEEIGKGNTVIDVEVEENRGFKANIRKYIKEIRIEENGKEKVYNYENVKKASISVRNIENAKVRVIYELVVKNTSEEAGYVKVVKEDIPEGLKYDNSYEINKEWEEDNGILYNKSLSKEKLRKGEEKKLEVGLLLEDNKEAKNYINEVSVTGEEYYKVKYIVGENVVRELEVLESDKVENYEYEEAGYEFKGWYKDKELTERFDFNERIGKDTIIYGKKEATGEIEKYTVTYKVENEEYDKIEEVIKGSKVPKTEKAEPKKTGYKFEGWVKAGEEEIYDYERDEKVEENITFNARFKIKEYDVEYYKYDSEGNYEENAYKEGKVKYNEEIELEEGPERKYYRFKYWSEDKTNEYENNKIGDLEEGSKIKLYAVYTINQCKLTIHADGETNEIFIDSNELVQNYLNEENKKEGYTYKYYATDEEGNNAYSSVYPIGYVDDNTCDLKLYKIYEINKYTVTFKDTLNDANPSPITVPYNTSIEENGKTMPVVSHKGYNFEGWYKGTEEFTKDTKVTKDIEVESKYNKLSFGITFHYNNGDANKTITEPEIEYGDKVSKPSDPEKEGYSFVNWYEMEGSTLKEEPFNFETEEINRVINVYAEYKANLYRINLDSKEAEIKGTERLYEEYNKGIYFEEEKTAELTEENAILKPQKTGYTFKGYYKDNKEYINENGKRTSLFTNTAFKENTTLEAKYEKNSYTLTINPDGGTYEGELEERLEYKAEYEMKGVEKEGYTFIGWEVEEENVYNSETNKVTMPAKDIIVKAKWTINTYTVDFYDQDSNGNYILEPAYSHQEINYKGNITEPERPNSREGYEFKYWSKEENGTSSYDLEEKVTKNIKLYAVYKEKEYEVIYVSEEEIVGRGTKVKYKEAISSSSAPEVSKEYNEFKGWKIKENYYDFTRVIGIEDISILEEKEVVILKAEFLEIPTPTISHTPTEWTNGNVIVTIEGTAGYEIEYKEEGENSYQAYERPFEVSSNKEIYARLKKGSILGAEVEHEIKNIDKQSPSIEGEVIETSATKNSININVSSEEPEDEKGIYSGIKEITIYKVENEEEVEVNKIENINAKEYENVVTINNLESETDYTFKIKVEDNAGNIKEKAGLTGRTKPKDYVALVTEINGEVLESPIPFESVQEAIDYEECETKACTVQIMQKKDDLEQIKDLEENGITVYEGQEITLDLNGVRLKSTSTNTITNLGTFTLTDRSSEETGTIVSENNNGIENKGNLNLGEDDGEVKVNLTVKGKTYGINSTGNNFNYYDGQVMGNQAINGLVTDKAYPYNVKVAGANPEVARLEIVSDPEAEVRGVYYGKIANAAVNALDSTAKDNYFHFVKEEDVLINNNQGKGNTTAKNYIKIDLTNYDNDQVLTINAEISSEENDIGYVTIKEEEEFPEVTDAIGQIIRISGEQAAQDYTYTLTKGKIYYVNIGYAKNSNTDGGEDTFKINSITMKTAGEEEGKTYTSVVPVLNEEVDTIRMLKDITLSESFEVEGTRDVILDLRGYKLTTAAADYVIKNDGSLKIIDSKYTDDIESAERLYEQEQAQYDAEYETAIEEYNVLESTQNEIYKNSYKDKVTAALEEKQARETAQSNYEQALEEYNQQMVKYNEDLEKYKKYLSKFTMPNMDGIVDYFDYNNYENGEWSNTLSDGNEMTIYGTPTKEDDAVVLDNVTNNNYAALPIDNSANSIIYMVSKFNGRYNGKNNRLYEIPYSISSFPNQTPLVTINGGNIIAYGAFNNDKNTSISGLDYHVTALIIDKTSNKLKFYVDGNYISELTFSGNYGNIIYLAKSNQTDGENGNNSYKMIAVGNELQTEEEIIENSNYLYYKYIEELPVDNTNPLVSNYGYTGNYQTFTAPIDGTYKVELWGAQGGSTTYAGGKGAYTSGEITLAKNEKLYVYVGEKGKIESNSYNGGGKSYNTSTAGAAGGGATDIRLIPGDWNNNTSLASRIMVAGAGGGASYYSYGLGGAGGTLTGLEGARDSRLDSSYAVAAGGTQISGGTVSECGPDWCTTHYPGGFGYGGDSAYTHANGYKGGGGGSGYYGGGGGADGYSFSGAGGSSYISGYKGAVAITAEDDLTPRKDSNDNECTDESALDDITCSYHYSGKKFTETVMKSGNEEMPTYNGTSTMTGNSGNGYAKITLVDYEGELPLEEAVEEPVKPVKPKKVTNGYTSDDYVSDDLLMHLDGIEHGEQEGVWKDLSQNNNNGVITGATWEEDNSLKFNGNAGLVSSNTINITKNSTFEILLNKSSSGGMAIDARTSSGSGYQALYFDGDTATEIYSSTGGSYKTTFSGYSNDIHLYTINYTETGVKIYLDGKFFSESNIPKGIDFISNIYLGRRYSNNYFFNGKIYNFKYYNRLLTEKEIKQNYEVDIMRYGLKQNYPSSNTSDGIMNSASGSDEVYKLFDGDKETTYSSSLTEEVITWNMEEENTIKSFKIYGSSDSSKYPSSVKIEGSKDGENYTTIIEQELEPKGLNEYNLIDISIDDIDSYKSYRYTFNNSNGLEINEIELEKYDITRETYASKEKLEVDSLKNLFTDIYSSTNGSLAVTINDNDISMSDWKDGYTGVYYNEKMKKEDTISGSYEINNNRDYTNMGELYIGFSRTNEARVDDYIQYEKKYISTSSVVTGEFNVSLNSASSGYFKIILHNASGDYSSYATIKDLNIYKNRKPQRQIAVKRESTLQGNVTSTTGNVIENNEGALLYIDDAIINIDKAGTSSVYTEGISNYGTLELTDKAIINNKVNYAVGIENKTTGEILDSPVTINITGDTGSYGIRNYSLVDEEISGPNIAMTTTNNYGILHYSANDLLIDNIKTTGSGRGIYCNSTSKLDIKDNNITSWRGIEITDGSGDITFDNNNVITSEIGILTNGSNESTIYYNGGNVISNSHGINLGNPSKPNLIINDGKIKANSEGYAIYTSSYSQPKVELNGGIIESNNIGIYLSEYYYGWGTFDKAVLNITGGEIESTSTGVYIGDHSYLPTVENVTIYNKGGSAIHKNSNLDVTNISNLIVNHASSGNGVSNTNEGTINIVDSDIYGSYAINNTKGTVNIDGETILTSTNSGIYNTSTINFGIKDGDVKTNYPKIISDNYGFNGSGTINWYDGQIIAKDENGINGRIDDTEENYDINVEDYTEDTEKEKITLWIPVLNSDESNAVAKIENTKYASVQDAINALDSSSNKKIELLKDIRTIYNNQVPSNKKGKFDLSNYNVKTYRILPLITNEGTLEITDSAGSGTLESTTGTLIENSGDLVLTTGTFITSGAEARVVKNSGILKTGENATLKITGNNGVAIDNSSTKVVTNEDNRPAVEINGQVIGKEDVATYTIKTVSGDIIINNSTIKSNAGDHETIQITGGKIVINEGTNISRTGGYGDVITLSNNSKIEMNGGTVTSSSINGTYDQNTFNISSESELTINYGTVNGTMLNNGTINVKQKSGEETKMYSPSATIDTRGTLNMYDGTIYGPAGTLIANSGTMNVSGGTINHTINSDCYGWYCSEQSKGINNTGTLTITEGEVIGTGLYTINNTNKLTLGVPVNDVLDEDNNIVVTGDGAVSKAKPVITSTRTGIGTTGTFNMYDGVVKGQTAMTKAPNEIEEGYEVITDSDEDYAEIKYLDRLPIAEILDATGTRTINQCKSALTDPEETDYACYTLEDAINAAQNGETIKILRNVTYTATKETIVIPETKNIKIDLNTYKVQTSSTQTLLNNQGTLEIDDSAGSGTLESTAGTLIENSGDLILTTGTFITSGAEARVVKNSGILKTGENTTLKITGNNGVAIDNSSTKVVTNEDNRPAVEINGEVLGKEDITTHAIKTISGDIIINSTSNIKVSAYGNNEIIEISGGKITLNGGSITRTGHYGNTIVLTNSSTFEMNGGTVTTSSVNSTYDQPAFNISSESELTINYGTVNGTMLNNGTINVKQKSGEETKIYSPGASIDTSGTLNMYDGTIYGPAGVLISNSGTMTVLGGTINHTINSDCYGWYCSEQSKGINNTGTLTITEGEIIGTGLYTINNTNKLTLGVPVNDVLDEDNNIVVTGDGAVSKTKPVITSTRTGIGTTGTFNMYDGVVKGQTAMTKAPNEIEEGYEVITDSDEDYVEIKYLDRLPIAEILDATGTRTINQCKSTLTDPEETDYACYTLEDAISAAQNGETIKILRNVTYTAAKETIEIPSSKNIKLDLNNYKIQTSSVQTLITNSGILEIIDSGSNGMLESVAGSIIENTGNLKVTKGTLTTSGSSGITIENKNTGTVKVGTASEVKCTGQECIVIKNSSTKMTSNEDNIPAVEIDGYVNGYRLGDGNKVTAIESSSGDIVINKDAKINASGGTFVSSYGLNISGGKVKITEAEVKCTSEGIAMRLTNNAVIEIKGGTFTGGNRDSTNDQNVLNLASGTQATIKYGTFVGSIANAGTLNIYQDSGKETKITPTGFSTSGTLNIYDGTIVGTVITLIKNSGEMNVFGGNITTNETSPTPDRYGNIPAAIYSTGTLDITGGTITSKNYSCVYNTGTLDITGGTFNASYNNIVTSGKADIRNIVLNTGTTGIIHNGTGEVNLNNMTISDIATGISRSGSGTLNIPKSVSIDVSDTAISNSGEGVIKLGLPVKPQIIDGYEDENGNVIYDSEVNVEMPLIKGRNYGINSTNASARVHFYDGQIIGGTTITGTYDWEPGYRVNTRTYSEDTTLNISTQEVSTVTIVIFKTSGVDYDSLQAAINNATDGVVQMQNDYTIDSDITVPSGKVIYLYTNGHTLTKNPGVTISANGELYIDDVKYGSNSLLGAIRKFLNLGETTNVRKNIVVYEMNDGSNLESTNEYELQILEQGRYVKVDVEEVLDNVGRYNIANTSSNTKMSTINGKIYINNIPNGKYKVVDNSGKEVSFVIDEIGKISGNVKENYTSNTNSVMSKSRAELIVNIQTGQKVIKYGILLTLVGGVIALLMIIRKKKIQE